VRLRDRHGVSAYEVHAGPRPPFEVADRAARLSEVTLAEYDVHSGEGWSVRACEAHLADCASGIRGDRAVRPVAMVRRRPTGNSVSREDLRQPRRGKPTSPVFHGRPRLGQLAPLGRRAIDLTDPIASFLCRPARGCCGSDARRTRASRTSDSERQHDATRTSAATSSSSGGHLGHRRVLARDSGGSWGSTLATRVTPRPIPSGSAKLMSSGGCHPPGEHKGGGLDLPRRNVASLFPAAVGDRLVERVPGTRWTT
jgi:hypothetical protein